MFAFRNRELKATVEIKHILKGLQLVFLFIIAYNSSYLKGIYQKLAALNQTEKVIVNVGAPLPAQSSGGVESVSIKDASLNQNVPKTVIAQPAKPAKKSSEVKRQAKSVDGAPKTHKVEMLNNSPDGAMVFSPPYIHINTGDSIEFTPSSYGHNVQTPEEIINSSAAIPENAQPFKGAMNEKLIVKFTVPGVYLYVCNYHYIVGHVGVIQVGEDSSNIDAVTAAGEKLKAKIFSHPERVTQYLKQVQVYS